MSWTRIILSQQHDMGGDSANNGERCDLCYRCAKRMEITQVLSHHEYTSKYIICESTANNALTKKRNDKFKSVKGRGILTSLKPDMQLPYSF